MAGLRGVIGTRVNPAAIITFVVGVGIFLACQKQTFFVNTVGITFIDMVVSSLLYMVLSKLQRS